MMTSITQALIVYALAIAISAGVAGMIKCLFYLVRRFSSERRE